jgi:transcriptional regulator with XRE-family HTH domain
MEHNPGALTPSQAVARHVRGLRKRRGLTAAQLADQMRAAGVPWQRSTVAKFENGLRQTVSIDEVVTLAQVLDVTIGDLLGTADSGDLDVLDELREQVARLERLLATMQRRASGGTRIFGPGVVTPRRAVYSEPPWPQPEQEDSDG